MKEHSFYIQNEFIAEKVFKIFFPNLPFIINYIYFFRLVGLTVEHILSRLEVTGSGPHMVIPKTKNGMCFLLWSMVNNAVIHN